MLGFTVATDKNGNLTGNANGKAAILTPAASDPQWLQRRSQQNIQRAAGNVVVEYGGKQYALVADYNFIFNDSHFNDYNDWGKNYQIGGKIGVIEDPFGANGGPKYLGATTPIPGGAIDHLTIGADGKLYGDVFIDQATPTGYRDFKSLFVWDAAALVKGALAGKSSTPISVNATRYDGATPGQDFGWTYGIGAYSVPGTPIHLVNAPELSLVTIGATISTAWDSLIDYLSAAPADNVYTRALGITAAQVDKEFEDAIKSGDTSALSASAYFGKRILYNGANFFTAGFVGRQGERYEATLQVGDGALSDANYERATKIDAVASVASIFFPGRGAGAAVARGGFWGSAGGVGAKAGAQFTLIQKAGEVGAYAATGYLPGGQASPWTATYATTSVIELATSTIAGAGLGFALSAILGKYPKLGLKMVWSTPSQNNPLPIKLVPVQYSQASEALLGTAADTGSYVALAEKTAGQTIKLNGVEFKLPERQSMTTEQALQWLSEIGKQMPKLMPDNLNLFQKAEQTVYLGNYFKAIQRYAMQNQEDVQLLMKINPFTSVTSGKSSSGKELSGDALWKKVIDDVTQPMFKLKAKLAAEKALLAKEDACFVAGTLVHTQNGLVPIEEIKVGDMVLSQPEETGALSYKPVTRTFVHEDKEVWLIYFRSASRLLNGGAEVAGRPEYLSEWMGVTENHPFYALKRLSFKDPEQTDIHKNGVWTNASHLPNSCVVETFDNSFATTGHGGRVHMSKDTHLGWAPIEERYWNESGYVVDFETLPLTVEYGYFGSGEVSTDYPPMLRTVFNIEVQDNHSYYVGELGLWVHNKNVNGLEVIAEKQAKTLDGSKPGRLFYQLETIGTSPAKIFELQTNGVRTIGDRLAAPAFEFRSPWKNDIPIPKGENYVVLDSVYKMPNGEPSVLSADAKYEMTAYASIVDPRATPKEAADAADALALQLAKLRQG